MAKKIIIIGAGISGLSAGCYARMNGYDVDIHESHSLPGGLCTAWRRGGYLIDGCIHWLVGSGPSSSYYRVWEELGVVQQRKFYDHEVFYSFVGLDGREVHFYTDPDRLEDHLMELSPQDSEAIADLCKMVRRLAGFQMPVGKPAELMGLWDGLRMTTKYLPYMKDIGSLLNMTLDDLGARFKDPLLRSAISNMAGDGSMPALALVMTLAPMSIETAGYPLGGSLEFALDIEKRFLDLGGHIHYRSRVERVLERNGKAVGVLLEGGSEVSADYVISACDMRKSLFSMLDGSRVDPLHAELLATGKLYKPCLLVSFGVDMDLSADISCLGTYYQVKNPVAIAGEQLFWFPIKNYCYDPSLAPHGKSVAGSFLLSEWDYWEPMIHDDARYSAEKEEIVGLCQEQIEQHYPGFSAKIEMTDVATPLTFARYTGNWHGTYMTWNLSAEFQRKHRFVPKTVPGLTGYYLASMWTDPPGGIPGAASAGRTVVQLLCQVDRQRFVTTTL